MPASSSRLLQKQAAAAPSVNARMRLLKEERRMDVFLPGTFLTGGFP